MSEDDIIAQAAVDALAKRTKHGSFVKPSSFVALPPMPKDEDFCKVCQYPLISGPSYDCQYCFEQKQKDAKERDGWIENIGGRRAWEDYTIANAQVIEANGAALSACRRFNPRTSNLFLHGPKGTGKSHAAALAKRPLIMAGFVVRTVSMPAVMDEILAGIKSGHFAGSTQTWVKVLSTVPVLSIEDMAVEKPSDHTMGFYYKFIDARYQQKLNGMIITCNLSLDDLENRWAVVDPQSRVVSRLKQMCKGGIYSFIGCPDWREQ